MNGYEVPGNGSRGLGADAPGSHPDQLDWFIGQYLEAGCHILASAGTWVKSGARVVGGCCGSTPAHAVAIGRALEDM